MTGAPVAEIPGHHRSLARQLRRLALSHAQPPAPEAWRALLTLVSSSYAEADADRYTLERSIEISGQEMRALHDLLSRQAHSDDLTGLPNRLALLELLDEALARRRAEGTLGAVLFIDLDGFKLINDGLGHAAGDELLARAAERIRGSIRDQDLVARLGGDEFVVLAFDLDDLSVATLIAERIDASLPAPFRIGACNAGISASVGIALLGAEATPSAEEALREADIAMYQAKTRGRSQVAVYGEDMRTEIGERLAVENALRLAVDAEELVLHYQPIVRLADFSVLGVEALVRWDRPGVGLVPPDTFIPVAEQSRLITAIDAFVVKEACRTAESWGPAGPYVSVNLSARDLGHDDLVSVVTTSLHRTGLSPHRLVVELTENTVMSGSPTVAANLGRIRSLGVQVAIDDFGTGHSSLAALRQLPARILKIDRSFVTPMHVDRGAAAVVGAIVTMAHVLGLVVVAEGVELVEQAQLLRDLGCDAAQGFLFSRPVPAEKLDLGAVAGPLAAR